MNVEDLERILQDNLVKKTKSNRNPERILEKQFRLIDLNHDNRVSLLEFRKALNPFLHGASDELVEQLFQRFDSDGNGYLDSKEFTKALFLSKDERRKVMQHRQKQVENSRRKSTRSDDIIEQAKRNRENRLNRSEKKRSPRFSRENINDQKESKEYEQVDASRKISNHRNNTKELIRPELQTGPFAKGGTGDIENFPKRIRYRVSKSWVSVHPSSTFNNYLLGRSSRLPNYGLQLEHVYGINSRCGLHSLENGEIVYASAGVGIVYNPKKHEQRFFFGHDDDITSVALDPTLTLCATGCMGKEPVVHIWDVRTMQLLSTIGKGFLDRMVCGIGFSGDSKRVVAIGADNKHMIGMWDISIQSQPKLISSAAGQNGKPPQIHGVFFHESNPDHFGTYGNKHIRFWKIDKDGRLKGKSGTFAQNGVQAPRKMLCGAFLGNEYTAITGGSNGYLYLWDTENCSCLRMFAAHKGPVLSLVTGDGFTIVTGGQDDNIVMWKGVLNENKHLSSLKKLETFQLPEKTPVCCHMGQNKKTKSKKKRTKNDPDAEDAEDSLPSSGGVRAISILRGQKGKSAGIVIGTSKNALWNIVDNDWTYLMGGHSRDLYGLGAHRTLAGAFVTVGEDNMLHIWDAETTQVVRKFQLFDQARSVDIAPDGNTLAVGFKTGAFAIIQVSSAKTQMECKHCEETIDDIKFSPDGKKLAVASHDNFIDLYDASNKYEHIARCKGHNSFITHIDWSRDSKFIQSTCGAYELLYWDARTGKNILQKQKMSDVEWETFTCVLGFDVMGVWQPGSDGTDVNALSRSPDGTLVVTGDDFGNVNLLNYPCVVDQAPAHSFKGHSSHVMNVRWLADGKRVVSVGGCDKSVFQWRLVKRSELDKVRGANVDSVVVRSNLIGEQQKWKATTSWK